MKRILVLLIFMIAMTSCATVPITEGGFSFKDGKNNDYDVKYTDNSETKKFKALVDIKGKTYSCEVDYTAAAPDAMGFDIDISALDITGKIKMTYKKVTVECSVENDVPDSEIADIIKENKE